VISINAFFHQASSTISYVVYEEASRETMIIDSALDYTAYSGKLWSEFADQQIAFIRSNSLKVSWILETHAHADHISAAHYLKSQVGGKIAAGAGIVHVQRTFVDFFDLPKEQIPADGSQFDCLFEDGDVFLLGSTEVKVLSTPGHTNDSVTYLVKGNAFVGDTLFMPDGGTARCDFPGGSAEVLYASIERLHQLADETVLWMCHDYQPNGRALEYSCTVAQSKQNNIHIRTGISCQAFVRLRESRDETLDIPRLLYPSVQLNINAGELPPKAVNGKRFIKQPISFTQV